MAKKTLTETDLNKAQRIYNPLAKRLYSAKEAAEYLGRSVWGIRELVWSQAIPIVKQAGCRKIYFDIKDLDSFIEKNKAIYS